MSKLTADEVMDVIRHLAEKNDLLFLGFLITPDRLHWGCSPVKWAGVRPVHMPGRSDLPALRVTLSSKAQKHAADTAHAVYALRDYLEYFGRQLRTVTANLETKMDVDHKPFYGDVNLAEMGLVDMKDV